MERRKFVQVCCYSAIGLPILATVLQSCGSIYYAVSTRNANGLIVAKSEFWKVEKNKKVNRPFVLIKTEDNKFPICVYKIEKDKYVASLLKCTHKSCELNVGGGIYSCPCHGSEFSITGKVLEGPADRDLETFKIGTDNENIYIYLS
ncbi:MAG: Rieske (2Fe-2S) protein [Bacteroidetes bacterium]|nr:MAG: Rieske (2Fe-2S) protein [Bacteroidota bacterium]